MEIDPANAPRCQGTRKDGSPCNATPTARSGYRFCAWHSPDIPQEEKAEWAQRGGLASRPTVLPEAADIRLRTPDGCMAILEETASQVRRGELASNVANSIGYLVSVAVKVVEVTISDRLDRLEKLARGRIGRWA